MTDTTSPVAGASSACTYDELLADAVRALTAAARLTFPAATYDPAASPSWVPNGLRRQADWAEFVSLALAGAAANVGGIETALAGRPGSWEADGLRNLLRSTVGHDKDHLLEHRTEPLVVEVDVDEILNDLGVCEAYDNAQAELQHWIGAMHPRPTHRQPDVEVDEVDDEVEALLDLEKRLEQQRERDWADYATALTASILGAAGRLVGVRVPVVVEVAVPPRPELGRQTFCATSWRLLQEAIEATPVPDKLSHPMERLLPND